MQLAYVLSHMPLCFVVPLQCGLQCTVQPEVLELEYGLALHVHLVGESAITTLKLVKSLRFCYSFAGVSIAEQLHHSSEYLCPQVG